MNDISIPSKYFAVVGSGCRVELPKNCIGLIRSNSKLFITKNVYIHPAKDTIFPSDSHDCELFILLQNDGESNVNISILEPIAIIKFLEYNNIDVIIKKMNNKKKVSK